MDKLNLQSVNFGSKNVENKAKKPKKEVKKKISDNKKSIKLALAGLAVLGTAAAAGVMIYRGKLNAENLSGLGTKTEGKKAAEQAQQVVQAIRKSEAPNIPVIEKVSDTVVPDAITSNAPDVSAKAKDEFSELLAKKDELTPSAFKRLAGLISGKTEEQEAEIARILSEKTEIETSRRIDILNRQISNWNGENDEYIKTISSYTDEQFEIVETLLKCKTRGVGQIYKSNPETLISAPDWRDEGLSEIKDEKRLQKILHLVSKDKGVKLDQAIKCSAFDDTMFDRTSALADRGLTNLVMFDDHAKAIQELDEKQFGRILELSDCGYGIFSLDLPKCAKLDDEAYEKALILSDKYGLTSNIHEIASLPNGEFQRVLKYMEAGVPAWKANGLTDEEFKNFQYLLSAGAEKDVVMQCVNLSDRRACEEFLQSLKAEPLGINIEDLENPEIKARIVGEINKQFGYEALKPDCRVEDIAWRWREKYVEGGWLSGGYSDSCVDAFLEKAMPRYEIQDGAKLGRWMHRDDLYKYIEEFPEVGETYAPKRIQSFAKTLRGAELYRGNNFSDTNASMNVKMVVTPKAKLTHAYDVKEGKYGADEVIYGATQRFEVLKKGFETVTNPDGYKHRQYVIYLKEL